MPEYRISIEHLTVVSTEDLNAEGEPCRTVDELACFVRELCQEGAYEAAVRDQLIEELLVEVCGG